MAFIAILVAVWGLVLWLLSLFCCGRLGDSKTLRCSRGLAREDGGQRLQKRGPNQRGGGNKMMEPQTLCKMQQRMSVEAKDQ